MENQQDKLNVKRITPRAEDYSRWYLDVIAHADLAEHAPVKGCMTIKPYGYAIWEKMQAFLDADIKRTGHKNAYFPLFVPKSFLSREASQVKGFAKECAVVTHHRLIDDPESGGVKVDPEAALEEEVVVRPTSETIIYEAYSRWIQSWRDLPVLINQWANIVRWEMRTRLFLRTTEFLWQEGHTAHATPEEAEEEALKMLDVYADFAENVMAMPVIKGRKPDHDKFPGAQHTYAIEALMQDGKALQAGTSHNLGTNFATAFDVTFADKDGERKPVWQTSWGVSTRLIGGLIMSHSDDKGLVLPPRLAPIKVVMVPIYKGEEDREKVLGAIEELRDAVATADPDHHVDDRDTLTPGAKFNEWEKKGVPVRLEVGPKDIEKQQIVLVRRDTGEKAFVPMDGLDAAITELLQTIQREMFERAAAYRTEHMTDAGSYDELTKALEEKGGFVRTLWCGAAACDEKVKEATKATIRCVPLEGGEGEGACAVCGEAAKHTVLFAKSY